MERTDRSTYWGTHDTHLPRGRGGVQSGWQTYCYHVLAPVGARVERTDRHAAGRDHSTRCDIDVGSNPSRWNENPHCFRDQRLGVGYPDWKGNNTASATQPGD